MATTTNYGWTTPDDTALVKDGASAIRTLGSSVDTSVKALNPGTTAGDLDYYTAATTKARIAKGTAGQVFTMNSGATAPEWQTLNAGGLTLLATATPSGASSLSFASISGSYTHLTLVWDGVFQSATGYWNVRLNNDSGTNYLWSALCRQDASLTQEVGYTTEFGSTRQSGPIGETGTTNVFSTNNYGQFTVFNYASTSVQKRVQWSSQSAVTGTQRYPYLANGAFNSASAVNRIDFIRSAAQTITGTFYLYGVK
jgi:hypothetical protein